jgi:hypothetical protein
MSSLGAHLDSQRAVDCNDRQGAEDYVEAQYAGRKPRCVRRAAHRTRPRKSSQR